METIQDTLFQAPHVIGVLELKLDIPGIAHTENPIVADALFLHRVLEIAHILVSLVLQGLVYFHTQDQMDASLEIQTQVDRLARDVGVPARQRARDKGRQQIQN